MTGTPIDSDKQARLAEIHAQTAESEVNEKRIMAIADQLSAVFQTNFLERIKQFVAETDVTIDTDRQTLLTLLGSKFRHIFTQEAPNYISLIDQLWTTVIINEYYGVR